MQHALGAWVSHGPATLVYLSVIPGNVLAAFVIARIWLIAGLGKIRGRWIFLIAALFSGISMSGVALVRLAY
jgi:hypothetical protein